MAIAVEAVPTVQTGSSVSSLTIPSTTASGSNTAIYACYGNFGGFAYDVPTRTGSTFTELDDILHDTNYRFAHAYTVGASGTQTITVSITAGEEPAHSYAGCFYLSGVDQATPIGTSVTATGSDDTPTVTVSTASGEVVCGGFMGGRATITEGADQPFSTATFEAEDINAAGVGGAGSSQAGADGGVLSWTIAGGFQSRWAAGAVPFKPASGGGPVNTHIAAKAMHLRRMQG